KPARAEVERRGASRDMKSLREVHSVRAGIVLWATLASTAGCGVPAPSGDPPVDAGNPPADAGGMTVGSWTAVAPRSVTRHYHAATPLLDGKVLVVGGSDSSGHAIASTEIFDEATASWSPAASLSTVRTQHTTTLLPSGKVLAAGGHCTISCPATAEL